MPSPDDIAKIALDAVGESVTANLLDDTADGRKLKRGYDFALTAILASYPWRIAHTRIQLAQLATAPTSTLWGYQFELPSDCIQPKRVNETDREPWAREGDRILTNVAGPLLLEYTRLVADPGLWTGTFLVAFATLLASIYAGTFKHDHELARRLRSDYFGVDLPEAKSQDAKAASISTISVPTLTEVRRF